MSDSTIFTALRADHETQRRLIDDLVDTTGSSGARKRIFAELKRELGAHAGAEERYFYVPLMEHDATQENARHSVAEHKELDDFVEQLDEYDMSGSEWLPAAQQLRERLLHHLEEEEVEVFPVAGRVLNSEDKIELAADYVSDMDRRRSD